tara:strand:+ start:145417 stop:146277 length:861 start_codon:yes stop_codon:yes gene_type:complete
VGKGKSPFGFNGQERNGIFFFLLAIVVFQIVLMAVKTYLSQTETPAFFPDRNFEEQLKQLGTERDTLQVFPFNPNYITDYRGYRLGLSTEQIDRLHLFRQQGGFVNSADDFQEVTKVSDSVLGLLSPYFKFPEWVRRKNADPRGRETAIQTSPKAFRDLNTATAEQLREISGIGEVLSVRIVKFRDRLGGFLVPEQLMDVYGLDTEVAQRALEQFKLLTIPEVTKISINEASATEISQLVYISNRVARAIVQYRELNGGISNFTELADIEGFPTDKIDRIGLYLSL